MSLNDRRRALMAQKPSGEQWDYVWNYTDGMPEDNGATKVTNGVFTIQMTNEGLSIGTDHGAYVAYRFLNYQSDAGTIECEFIMPEDPWRWQNIRIGYSDGTSGFQIESKSGNVAPMESSTPMAGSILGAINTVKVCWGNSKGAFWLNGTMVGENLLPTQYSGNTQVMIQNTGGIVITIRSIRIRKE